MGAGFGYGRVSRRRGEASRIAAALGLSRVIRQGKKDVCVCVYLGNPRCDLVLSDNVVDFSNADTCAMVVFGSRSDDYL